MDEQLPKDVFTVLYELKDQQYIIGVTNDERPMIAAIGVNTARPLPQNIKEAFMKSVRALKKIERDPIFMDYNAPSSNMTRSILGNLDVAPSGNETPHRTVEEAVATLKLKMQKESE